MRVRTWGACLTALVTLAALGVAGCNSTPEEGGAPASTTSAGGASGSGQSQFGKVSSETALPPQPEKPTASKDYTRNPDGSPRQATGAAPR